MSMQDMSRFGGSLSIASLSATFIFYDSSYDSSCLDGNDIAIAEMQKDLERLSKEVSILEKQFVYNKRPIFSRCWNEAWFFGCMLKL
jgi:hypothetical protein